jgi:hypothetical protein
LYGHRERVIGWICRRTQTLHSQRKHASAGTQQHKKMQTGQWQPLARKGAAAAAAAPGWARTRGTRRAQGKAKARPSAKTQAKAKARSPAKTRAKAKTRATARAQGMAVLATAAGQTLMDAGAPPPAFLSGSCWGQVMHKLIR